MRTSVRMALIGAVGTTVMVALHVSGPLGPVTLWVALTGSNRQMTVREAIGLLATVGAAIIASVFVAGALVDAPWLLLPVLGLVTTLALYSMQRWGLAGPWLPSLGIGVIDTFYVCVFDPVGFGWTVANTYAGVALAVAVVLVFDTALWPDPAEHRLVRSLAHALHRECRRLTAIVRAYVDRAGDALPGPDVVSILPAQLPLIERARRELHSPQREAVVLAAVITTERLHIEIERVRVIARAEVPRDLRARLAPDLEAVRAAIVAALHHQAQRAAAGSLPCDPAPYEPVRAALHASLDALRAQEAGVAAQLPTDEVVTASRVAELARGLRKIGELLDRPLGSVDSAAFAEARPAGAPPGRTDRAVIHHVARVGLAVTFAYVVGLASQRADLSVIMWTTVLTGQSTYGATLHKAILYVVGAVIGGVLTLATIIVVSPNSESVSPYLAAFFVVLFLCSYVGLSSGRLAYAGLQIGMTFIFAYYGLSPSADVAEPLWRLWGILLGLASLSAVFLLAPPQFAGQALLPCLARLFRGALDLLRPTAGLTRSRIHDIGEDSTRQLTRLLGIADDARLEGRHSQLRPDRVIGAAGTLRRILQRLAGMAMGREATPQVALPAELAAARAAMDAALCAHLQAWLDAMERLEGLGADQRDDRRRVVLAAEAQVRAVDLALPLAALDHRVSDTVLAEPAAWPAETRSSLLAELASYDRLRELMSELDDQLTHIQVVVEPRVATG
ncbi:MAG TPA: FUSC family protein [Kofleriaceae bacterium]|nr:FUSC family protein [Kofleriaceae bacterium]